ncbi:uncharacterized protein LOC116214521 [Punica granatum]|uniref:Uncharacterized protein LOC116214521 n=1 Tax=Punica granatum TaxID=22663 RepID=A0A6P8EJE7_PUNGR|nr:uncharacterized protein LOC116214521 [Punica granatum]
MKWHLVSLSVVADNAILSRLELGRPTGCILLFVDLRFASPSNHHTSWRLEVLAFLLISFRAFYQTTLLQMCREGLCIGIAGQARVWIPNNDSRGLAMARAFCDFCLKDFGLISVPDIFYRRLTEGDELIILATDGPGYGMFSRTREAVDIMASAPGRATASCPRSRGLCGSGLEAQVPQFEER